MSINLSSTAGLTPMQKSVVAASDVQWELVKTHGWQCCLNCERFDKAKETCEMNGNQRPPAQVILLGCKDHMCDIPF